jgi:hypothetical protein
MMEKKCIALKLIICLAGLVPVFGIAQPDIPMNPDLKSNSESWKVKVKQNGIWGKKPAIVNFGPVKTVSTGTEKNEQSLREVNRELYWKNIHTIKSTESSMELELNGTDTARIRMLTMKDETTKEKNVAGTMANVNGSDEESYRVSTWLDEMNLSFQNDSAVWHYIKLDSGSAYGVLEKRSDLGQQVFLHQVSNLEGKKIKEIMFTQPALGFVFEYQGKQVAAIQTLMKQNIWISKALDADLKKVILATAAVIMATVKSGNANGF